jgi:hypothetical protein
MIKPDRTAMQERDPAALLHSTREVKKKSNITHASPSHDPSISFSPHSTWLSDIPVASLPKKASSQIQSKQIVSEVLKTMSIIETATSQ